MTWWLWTLFGLFLLILEVFTPTGFYIMFFGIGAILVGALEAMGIIGSPWVEWLLFSVLSLVSLLILRRPLLDRLSPKGDPGKVESFVGELAVLMEDLTAGGAAKAELRGSAWSARSTAGTPLSKGQRCRVDRVDGLTLWLRAE